MKIGYARVSTGDQSLRLQIDALKAAGCERIFEDHGVSGAAVMKPAYGELLRFARPGDELVVWRLDRLSRSLITLITELQLLANLNLGFRSLTEQIETVTPAGQLFFHIVAAFSQFERDVIRERTRAGIESARRAGKKLGRPPAITADQWSEALTLLGPPASMSPAAVAKVLGISRQAMHKRLKIERAKQGDAVAGETLPAAT